MQLNKLRALILFVARDVEAESGSGSDGSGSTLKKEAGRGSELGSV